jgi:hypothetical protein
MKKKRKRLIDQIYNGAFENVEFDRSTKNAVLNSALIILVGMAVNYSINVRNK